MPPLYSQLNVTYETTMTDFLFAYGLFFAKVATGLIALIIVIAILAGSRRKEPDTLLKVTDLGEKYRDLKDSITQSVLDKKEYKKAVKEKAKEKKEK